MRYHADTGHPFDTNNHANHQVLTASGEHPRTVAWTRNAGRTVILTRYDLATRDALTPALLDSIEASHTHALLVLHRHGTLSLHSPFDGETAAAAHAPALTTTDQTTTAATLPLPLHHRASGDQPPNDAWRPLHHQERHQHVAPAEPAPALLLLDRPRQRLPVVGPFPDHTALLRWEPTTFPDADIDCVTVAMHLDATIATASGDDGGGDD